MSEQKPILTFADLNRIETLLDSGHPCRTPEFEASSLTAWPGIMRIETPTAEIFGDRFMILREGEGIIMIISWRGGVHSGIVRVKPIGPVEEMRWRPSSSPSPSTTRPPACSWTACASTTASDPTHGTDAA